MTTREHYDPTWQPYCGRCSTINRMERVDGSINHFCCVKCGARHTRQTLLPEDPDTPVDPEAKVDMDAVMNDEIKKQYQQLIDKQNEIMSRAFGGQEVWAIILDTMDLPILGRRIVSLRSPIKLGTKPDDIKRGQQKLQALHPALHIVIGTKDMLMANCFDLCEEDFLPPEEAAKIPL